MHPSSHAYPVESASIARAFKPLSNPEYCAEITLQTAAVDIACRIFEASLAEDDEYLASKARHAVDVEISILAAKRKLNPGTLEKLRMEIDEGYFVAKNLSELARPEAQAVFASMTEPELPDAEIECLERLAHRSQDSVGPIVQENGFTIGRSLSTATANQKKWLVDGIIPRTGLIMLYGETGIGKSYAAIDLAFAITAGSDWAGRETSPFEALYIPTEDAYGIDRRNTLIARQRGLSEYFKPLIVDCQFDLSRNSDSVVRLIENLRGVPGPIGLVIIDTMQMALGGADENSANEATAIVENCRRLSLYLDCAVLLVHHSGKDGSKKARGSSAFMAAMDTVIHMTKSKSGVVLKVVKQKNGPGGFTCSGKLLLTDGGDGCYLQLDDWSDGVSEPRKASKAPLSEIVLGLVADYCGKTGSDWVSRNEITDMLLGLPDWKDKSRDSVRKALQRAINQLVEDKDLSADHTAVYLSETSSHH